jgi:hypothetical protein
LSAARFSETAPGFSATLRRPVFLGQFWQQGRPCRVVNEIRSVDFSRHWGSDSLGSGPETTSCSC